MSVHMFKPKEPGSQEIYPVSYKSTKASPNDSGLFERLKVGTCNLDTANTDFQLAISLIEVLHIMLLC